MSWWAWPSNIFLPYNNNIQQPSFLSELLRIVCLTPRSSATTPSVTDNLAPTSPLLQLPPELRDEIYRFALLSSNTTLSLLTTSHSIKMEAQPLLYQRPIKLSAQSKLFDWTARSRASNLKQVRNLTLHLTDIDLSPLLDPDAIFSQPPVTAWSLYEDEVVRFDNAFHLLSGLLELTIIPPRIMHSQLMRGLYHTLLSLIPRRYPRLRLLVIHDESAILDAVAALQGLPKVSFKAPVPSAGDGREVAGTRCPRLKTCKIKKENA
jgi:hypothetical protein